MGIRYKLNLIVMVNLIGMLIAVFLLIGSSVFTARIAQLNSTASQSIQSLLALNSRTRELMMTRDELKDVLAKWDDDLHTFSEALEGLLSQPALSGGGHDRKGRVEKIVALWDSLHPEYERVQGEMTSVLNDTIPGVFSKTGILPIIMQVQSNQIQTGQVYSRLNQLETLVGKMTRRSDEFVVASLESLVRDLEDESQQLNRLARGISLGILTVVVLASLIISLGFSSRLSRRIESISGVMEKVASRDLRVRASEKGRDEIELLGRNVNKTLDTFAEFIKRVTEASRQSMSLQCEFEKVSLQSSESVTSIAETVAHFHGEFQELDHSLIQSNQVFSSLQSGLTNLSESMNDQTSSLAENSRALTEIDEQVQSTHKIASQRRERASELLDAISRSGENIEEANSSIRTVSREIEGILEIIEIINGISGQTNLLSMNAAIESAHAGESGRGFAVVAEETRKLAEVTSENAKDIDGRLKGVADMIMTSLNQSEKSLLDFQGISSEMKVFIDVMGEISRQMDILSQGSRKVLESLHRLSEKTSLLNKEGSEMKSQGSQVEVTLERVENLSGKVNQGMNSIEEGTEGISRSLKSLVKQSHENREQLASVEATLNSFELP